MTALALCLSLLVTDGDTAKADCGRGVERLRLAGLDCPELRDRGGPAAKHALERLTAGQEARIERLGLDKYGRTIARLYVAGNDATCTMIRLGVCRRYVRYDREGRYAACE